MLFSSLSYSSQNAQNWDLYEKYTHLKCKEGCKKSLDLETTRSTRSRVGILSSPPTTRRVSVWRLPQGHPPPRTGVRADKRPLHRTPGDPPGAGGRARLRPPRRGGVPAMGSVALFSVFLVWRVTIKYFPRFTIMVSHKPLENESTLRGCFGHVSGLCRWASSMEIPQTQNLSKEFSPKHLLEVIACRPMGPIQPTAAPSGSRGGCQESWGVWEFRNTTPLPYMTPPL